MNTFKAHYSSKVPHILHGASDADNLVSMCLTSTPTAIWLVLHIADRCFKKTIYIFSHTDIHTNIHESFYRFEFQIQLPILGDFTFVWQHFTDDPLHFVISSN